MDERQTNYTVAEGYELPSKGLIYETAKVNSHVELRSMTARDEMKRLNPSSTPFKTLADIIEGCLIEKPAIHVYDMALGDYEYLLHKLRIVSYGDSYKMTLGCPHCGESVEATAHLEELELVDFDTEKFNSFRTFTLPRSGKIVSLKIQTPGMLDAIEVKVKEMKRKFKDAGIDFNTFVLLTTIIDTVDGNTLTQLEMESFVNTLPVADMNKILHNIDNMNACVGLKNELSVNCDKCGGEIKTFFRFGLEFFRPSDDQ